MLKNLIERNFDFSEKEKLTKMVMSESLVHHFYNRHEGFMQPTLVENLRHLDYKCHENEISE